MEFGLNGVIRRLLTTVRVYQNDKVDVVGVFTQRAPELLFRVCGTVCMSAITVQNVISPLII